MKDCESLVPKLKCNLCVLTRECESEPCDDQAETTGAMY